jgi:hypothetical protein
MNSVVGRYRFEAQADPNPTLHFDDDPDWDPTQSFTHIGKSGKNSDLLHCSASLHCFIPLVSYDRCDNFNVL